MVQLLRSADDMPMNAKPLWDRSDLSDTQLIAQFQTECQVVRKSIDGDLVKVCNGSSRESMFELCKTEVRKSPIAGSM